MSNLEYTAGQPDQETKKARKMYAAPRLMHFGSAGRLTLGTTGSGADFNGTQCVGAGNSAECRNT